MRLALFLLAAASLAATARASEVGCPARVDVPTATASFYDPVGLGACGLPAAPGELVAAIAEADWNGSQACGRCARVTGPLGVVTVRITDLCPADEFNPLCVAGHLDLSRAAFLEIATEEQGVADIAWESVACEVAGPVVFYFDPSSNPFFVWLQIRNHRYGIAKVEMRLAGEDWTEVARSDFNAFTRILPSAAGAAMDLRVTDVHGAVLESLAVPFTVGVEIAASGQFQTCPEPGVALAGSAVLALLGLRRARR